MEKYQGKAQPKFVYKQYFTGAIIPLVISIVLPIIFPISTPIDWLCFSFFLILTIFSIIYGLFCRESFYMTDEEIVVKNCFKKLKVIKKCNIKNIYVDRVRIHFRIGQDFYWQYIVITELEKDHRKGDIYRPYLNAKYRKEMTIDFSCKNEDIINEWTKNKFDLYE